MEENQEESMSRRPSRWLISMNIPELFSFEFGLSQNDEELNETIVYFKRIAPYLNGIINGSVSIFNRIDIGIYRIRLMDMESKLKEHHTAQAFIVRVSLKLAIARLTGLLVKPQTVWDKSHLREIFILLFGRANLVQNEVFWWYYASTLFVYQPNISLETFVRYLLKCVDNIHSSTHRDAVFYWIWKQINEKADNRFFENDTLSVLLKSIAERFPNKPWVKDLPKYIAELKHEFIQNQLENKAYFAYQSLSYPPNFAVTKKCKMNLLDNGFFQSLSRICQTDYRKISREYELTLENKLLYKYAAHIAPPGIVEFQISIEGCCPIQLKSFNLNLRKALRAQGYCCAEGFLDKKVINLNHFPVFKKIVLDTYRGFFKQGSSELEENLSREWLKTSYFKHENFSKKLSGMPSFETVLTLTERCLIPHASGLSEALRQNIQKILCDSLVLVHLAKLYSKQSHFAKMDSWFNLAKYTVNFLAQGNSFLIPVGSPIKEGKNSTDHAIYLVVKYSSTTRKHQILIINGGSGVKKFHKPSATNHAKDRAEYRVASFEPIDLTKEDARLCLQQYIYRLISLQYTPSSSNDLEETDADGAVLQQDNIWTFSALFRNVYLRTKKSDEEEYFLGKASEKYTCFRRTDSDLRTFSAQFRGNCTIHNLKYAFNVLFDMNDLEFGCFQDNLLLGLDSLINFCKSEKVDLDAYMNLNIAASNSRDFTL